MSYRVHLKELTVSTHWKVQFACFLLPLFFMHNVMSHQQTDEESNEDLPSQEVSKVDVVLSSLNQNDEVSQLGNSAVQSQGNPINHVIY